jgi:cation diffusion facilitator CzcD-associated flavoprotein CzcO
VSVVGIIGAGPYGLSLAAHLAGRDVAHRVFGRPMQFWSRIAKAGGERYLKSFCFGTNISTPRPGSSFADYNEPRGLEAFEPCSIANFAEYGQWFQQRNVHWAEPVEAMRVERQGRGFVVTLADGERFIADHVVIATGLAGFQRIPSALTGLSAGLVTHSSDVSDFRAFEGRDVAVIGAGQSALEAAALLREARARPQLLARKKSILWQTRISQMRSLWRRLRSPISGLGTGPKAWALTNFPGAMHRAPIAWRTRFVKTHLPPEGAWWLRDRVENRLPVHIATRVVGACEQDGRVALRLRNANDASERDLIVDHVIAGTGYDINVERVNFLCPKLRGTIQQLEGAPKLNSIFETSVPGLHFVGPASAMSFGPLFRFVVGADYTARRLSAHLASIA